MKIHPAIMIGGSGTRLWPLSRANKPKQFLNLFGDASLFQDTVRRFDDPHFGPPWLLTNADTIHHALSQLGDLGKAPAGVVVEPLMRGTAAALAAIALVVAAQDPEALVLAAPADHVIQQPALFRQAVKGASRVAAAGGVVTFGLVPTAPDTGFGYIRGGRPIETEGNICYQIEGGGFLEKPSRDKAEAFITAGYFWNAGIFLFNASVFLHELRLHAPDTVAAVEAALGAASVEGGNVWRLDAAAFALAPADLSIDYALMERTDRAVVVPCPDIGWSDVGSLSALWDIEMPSPEANVVRGDALCLATSGSLIHSGSGRKVVAAHLNDMMVVDTPDAVLVLPRTAAQSVKDVVKALKQAGAPEVDQTREALFPWGRLVLCDRGDAYLCLRVELLPGASMPARTVLARVEIWTVVSGALLDGEAGGSFLQAGQSKVLSYGERATLVGSDTTTVSVVVISGAEEGKALADLFWPNLTQGLAARKLAEV